MLINEPDHHARSLGGVGGLEIILQHAFAGECDYDILESLRIDLYRLPAVQDVPL